uniref:Reverse transcriptase domain-containing protein n=1 Tax=Ananas comosus var. bracteatus TaxID=296719 RepID=A0A6V7PY96_ANACO|nr:unnamed protein product [Ananas comosus var. bracteatus]
MPVDLLALHKLGEFDVVLGMDWLTQYYATIDCTNRTVTFREPGQQEVVYKGYRSSLFAMTISSSRARQLIRRGCVAYLASISVSDGEAVKIDDIPVVREFRDVFPTELPGMPPDREVEFVIDLVPGTTPISKTPYRMAPAELKELKAQLQDLLDKGFIRPSVSPWEHRCCLLRRRMDLFDCVWIIEKSTKSQSRINIHCPELMTYLISYKDQKCIQRLICNLVIINLRSSLKMSPRLLLGYAAFMDLMNRVFKPYLDKFVVVFIDDI